MGTKFYGIVAAQNPDNVNEIINLDGLDDRLRFIRDEHSELSAFRVLGDIKFSKKIFSLKDCDSDKQKKAYMHAKVPILYAEGNFFDDEDHPNAQAAVSILRYCHNHDSPLKPGLSVDGAIMERQDKAGNKTEDRTEGKVLAKTVAHSGAFTVQPCNPICGGALWLDEPPALQKSLTPPPAYQEALQKSQAASSFFEMSTEELLLVQMRKLKKSLENLNTSLTTIKCFQCGKGERFFKSEAPNCCKKCGSNYTVKQIWESLQK